MTYSRRKQRVPGRLLVLLLAFGLVGAAACGDDEPAATAAPAAPAAAAPATEAPDFGTLTMAEVGVAITQATVGVAEAAGFFQEEGFSKVVHVSTGAGGSAIAALLAGDADVGVMGSPEVVNTIALGEDLVFIGALYKGFPVFVSARNDWVAEKGISPSDPLDVRVKAMEGANIGILGEGSTVAIFARFMLESVGLDPDTDAQLIPFDGVASLVAGFETGAVDLMPLANPFTAQLDAAGVGGSIVGGTEFPEFVGFLQVGVTARPEDLARDPARYEAMWRALRKAHKLIIEDSDKARDLLHAWSFESIDDDVFAAMWNIEANPQSGPVYITSVDPVITAEDLGKVISFKNLEGVNAADVIDTSILEKVIAEEG